MLEVTIKNARETHVISTRLRFTIRTLFSDALTQVSTRFPHSTAAPQKSHSASSGTPSRPRELLDTALRHPHCSNPTLKSVQAPRKSRAGGHGLTFAPPQNISAEVFQRTRTHAPPLGAEQSVPAFPCVSLVNPQHT